MDLQCLITAFEHHNELTKFALSDRCGHYGAEFQAMINQAIAAGLLQVASTDFDETGEEVPLTYALTEKGKALR
jgi:hypothetical protein